MRCFKCDNFFPPDELDSDKLCYDCANYDPEYNPNDITKFVKLVEATIELMANARHITPQKLKTDLINESTIDKVSYSHKIKNTNNN